MRQIEIIATRAIMIVAVLAFGLAEAVAQTRGEVIAKAQQLVGEERYGEARTLLEGIVVENEKEARANYLMGVSEAMDGRNLADAVRRLKMAQMKNDMKNDCNLSIGRAQMLMFEYEQAQQSIEKFLQGSKDVVLSAKAEKWLQDIVSGERIASKIFAVKTVTKRDLAKGEILTAYKASAEVGTVSKNSRFFEADIDPEGIMYMTERKDAVYFSMADDEGKERLRKMEKLIGGWGEMQLLEGTTSEDGEEKMPVLMTDGQTLYFASNREGGMGGYDIYKSTYDPESRTFSEPENMGVPFNSAYDDLLFVADEYKHRAWFASGRETHSSDTLTVYEIVWDESVIRSTAKTTEEIRAAMEMPIDSDVSDAPTEQRREVGGGEVAIKEAFRLQICDSLTYTQWEHFRSQRAARTYRQVVAAKAEKDSLLQVMVNQRKAFMELTSGIERNQKLQVLLRTERSLYTLDDEIAEKTEAAKNDEIETIKELIKSGKYRSLSAGEKTQKRSSIDWGKWLKKENFSTYSDVVFKEVKDMQDEDVMALFSEKDQKEIELQDSLMAWGQLIDIEAGTLRENPEKQKTARDYSTAARILMTTAMDRKATIYKKKIDTAVQRLGGEYETKEIEDLEMKGARYFDLVKDVDPATAPVRKAQDALTMRRRGMTLYEKALQRFVVHQDGTFPLQKKGEGGEEREEGNSAKGVSEEVEEAEKEVGAAENQRNGGKATKKEVEEKANGQEVKKEGREGGREGKKETKTEVRAGEKASVETKTEKAENPDIQMYKIQFHASAKRPDVSALPDASKVSQMQIPGKKLYRFYYGKYKTQAEAEKDVPAVRAAGFGGAFVVGFDKSGQQVKIEKE